MIYDPIANPELAAGYQQCKALTAQHGKSYYLATALLNAAQRQAVYALYGFARTVDDIVDHAVDTDPEITLRSIDNIANQVKAGLSGKSVANPIFLALCDTVTQYRIPVEYLWAFLHSMQMDIPVSEFFQPVYKTMTELKKYMYGSASVIGLQLLPVLGVAKTISDAEPFAAALGEAFQLTNFLRDIAEDLARGRIYLPTDDLKAFGVEEDLLHYLWLHQSTDPRLKRALAHFIALTRALYRKAEHGIALLHPTAQPCVRTALRIYAEILSAIEEQDYRVMQSRAVVAQHKKLALALPGVLQATTNAALSISRVKKPWPAHA
ncbi:MAG: phytoene/squalene synthase family protein [Mycobacteriaceae bacterium]